MIEMIYASTLKGVIGNKGQIPWHLPEDLQYFKKMTLNKNVVMGRKTFESIGRPLPGRKNIVLTTQEDWSHDGVEVYHSPHDIPYDDLIIAGGAQVYAHYETRAQRIYWTLVLDDYPGDTVYRHAIDEWKVASHTMRPPTHVYLNLTH